MMFLQNGEMVGAEGFEPSTFCSRSKRATRLRYAPTLGSRLKQETLIRRKTKQCEVYHFGVSQSRHKNKYINKKASRETREAFCVMTSGLSRRAS